MSLNEAQATSMSPFMISTSHLHWQDAVLSARVLGGPPQRNMTLAWFLYSDHVAVSAGKRDLAESLDVDTSRILLTIHHLIIPSYSNHY